MRRRASDRVVPDRERQALELRKAGATYAQIAKQLGYANEGGAHKAVGRALNVAIKQRNIVAEDVRELELQRLDQMLLGLWADAKAGKWHAIDRVLKIMERRSAYLGLDAPKKTELSGPEGRPIEVEQYVNLTVEQRNERILAIVDAARARANPFALPAESYLAPADGTADGSLADAG
jgi:hypothetical protein